MENFRSLCSGLLLLLASLRRPPTLHEKASRLPLSAPRSSQLASVDLHADVYYVQQAIHKVLSGSVGELDENTVVSYYNAEYTSADRTNSDAVRHAIFTDALLDCIENTPAVDEWMIHGAIEVFSSIIFPVLHKPNHVFFQGVLANKRKCYFFHPARRHLQQATEYVLPHFPGTTLVLARKSPLGFSQSPSVLLLHFFLAEYIRHPAERSTLHFSYRVHPTDKSHT